jgi:hypothetical protein
LPLILKVFDARGIGEGRAAASCVSPFRVGPYTLRL